MISFDAEQGRFNYRSVAVIIHQNHVLIHRAEEDDFWAMPGGRVEFFEYSDATVVREIGEELGIEANVNRHLWHVESFFEYREQKFHEVANYYLVSVSALTEIESEVNFKGIEQPANLIFCWVPLAGLGKYNLYPQFLIERVGDLPATTEYLQINDINS